MKRNIISFLLSVTTVCGMFVPCASAAEGDVLSYVFEDQSAPYVADGTVTLALGNRGDLTGAALYWGSDSQTKLEGYAAIKSYVPSGSDITYTIDGDKFIPEGANYLIAELTTANGAELVSVELPAEKKFIENDNFYSMFWASDIHSAYTSYNESYGFDKMAQVAANDEGKCKGLILNGDLADTGKAYEYSFLEDGIDTYLDGIAVYYNTGNHDVANFDEKNCYEAMKVRFNKLSAENYPFERTDKWSYDAYINGQHYIFLSTPYGEDGDYALSDAQAAWLENEIAESEKSGVPTFVFSHLPVAETTPGSYKAGNAPISTIKAILQRHPSVIAITSHVHLKLDSDMQTLVSDGTNTYIDTGSMKYTSEYASPATAGEWADGSTKSYDNIYTRYVKIYDDMMVVKTLNLKTGKFIPVSEYIVSFNGEKFDGNVSIKYDTLSANSVVSAKVNDSDITDAYTVEWYKNGAVVGTEADYTLSENNENVLLKVTNKATNAYAWASFAAEAYEDEDETPEVPIIPDDGEDFPDVTVDGNASSKYNESIVNISGNAGAENAGKTATVILIPEATYYDLSTAKYINNCTVNADGSYSFKFVVNADANDVAAVKIDGQDVSYSVTSAKASTEKFITYTYELNAENKLVLDLKNVWLNALTAKVVVAVYDANGALLSAAPADCAIGFENGTYTSDALSAGSIAKVFVWDSTTSMIPLADATDVIVPAAEVTE